MCKTHLKFLFWYIVFTLFGNEYPGVESTHTTTDTVVCNVRSMMSVSRECSPGTVVYQAPSLNLRIPSPAETPYAVPVRSGRPKHYRARGRAAALLGGKSGWLEHRVCVNDMQKRRQVKVRNRSGSQRLRLGNRIHAARRSGPGIRDSGALRRPSLRRGCARLVGW